MQKNAEKRKNVGISASTLGGCPRQYLLGRDTDYYEDPEDYYARWFGSFGHYAIEMDGPYPDIIQEARFFRAIDTAYGPVEISGQPDWIDTRLGIIADHKMVGRKPSSPRQEHIAQLNVYKWLIDGDLLSPHTPIRKLEIRYYHPGSNGRHTEFEVPTWDVEDTESYICRAVSNIMRGDYIRTDIHDFSETFGIRGQGRDWMLNYCPWRHSCNAGVCCLAE